MRLDPYRHEDDAAFLRDKRLYGPGRRFFEGYRWQTLSSEPDSARIEAIEVAVAQGILRWMTMQGPGIGYDYWLIWFGVVGDEPWTTETWPKLRRKLWTEMQADFWLDERDCQHPEDWLWQRALLRVQNILFQDRSR